VTATAHCRADLDSGFTGLVQLIDRVQSVHRYIQAHLLVELAGVSRSGTRSGTRSDGSTGVPTLVDIAQVSIW
jgi:hypothetical protein